MKSFIDKIFEQEEWLIPTFLSIPDDKQISKGNLAFCLNDESTNK
jgi:hypothetical protein